MATQQDGDDSWMKRRFGEGARTGMASGRRAALYAAGLAGSLVLLAAFYLVLQQSLARAQQHWAQARQAEPCAGRQGNRSEACSPGSTALTVRLPHAPSR